MEKGAFAVRIAVALFAGIAVLTFGQAAQKNQTLVVSGYHGELAVVEMGGHPYVEIQALARLMNGSVAFQGSQIVLTLPGTALGPPAGEPAAGSPSICMCMLARCFFPQSPHIKATFPFALVERV